MDANTPTVDTQASTVTLGDRTFTMRQLSPDAYTVLHEGVPVGRVVYSFGANAVVESDAVTEEQLTSISEAWFAALG